MYSRIVHKANSNSEYILLYMSYNNCYTNHTTTPSWACHKNFRNSERKSKFSGAKLDENILKHCSKLKVISRHGVGYDNVDLNYIKKNNITLLITATANAVAVAEHVIYMMLSISKGLNLYDQEVRDGNFKKNASKIETLELFKKDILIVGFGRIGKSLIKREV